MFTPLEKTSDVLYNGQVTEMEDNVYVVGSLDLVVILAASFHLSFPNGFFATPTLSVKTNVCFASEHIKQRVKVGEKVVFALDSIFLNQIMVG